MTDNALGSDVPAEGATSENRVERLLAQSEYQPKELAELLDMPVSVIEHDAFAGKLKATIVEHDIIGISREAAIAWLNDRG